MCSIPVECCWAVGRGLSIICTHASKRPVGLHVLCHSSISYEIFRLSNAESLEQNGLPSVETTLDSATNKTQQEIHLVPRRQEH